MQRSDETVQQDVLDELSFDPRVDAANIGVVVHDGAVTLTGHVESYAEKYAAENAAKMVLGVKALASEIEVDLPGYLRFDDADIAERVAHVISSNVAVPDDAVMATVKNGVVTLTGAVPWQHQRETLETQVAHVRGVRRVICDVVLRPSVSIGNVREIVEKALHRNADVEADRISIRADGSKVILEGSVRAYYERDLVERAAWGVPGVTQVIDHIRIA